MGHVTPVQTSNLARSWHTSSRLSAVSLGAQAPAAPLGDHAAGGSAETQGLRTCFFVQDLRLSELSTLYWQFGNERIFVSPTPQVCQLEALKMSRTLRKPTLPLNALPPRILSLGDATGTQVMRLEKEATPCSALPLQRACNKRSCTCRAWCALWLLCRSLLTDWRFHRCRCRTQYSHHRCPNTDRR